MHPTDRPTIQATCRTFRLLAQGILSHPSGVPRPARPAGVPSGFLFSPVLLHNFGSLLTSSLCFKPTERWSVHWFLSLNGDVSRPFRRLPWVAGGAGGGEDGNAALRDVFLRPDASWRGLSVTFARGTPITRLEVVKSYWSKEFYENGRNHVQHLLVDLSSSGGFLTMGLLYDLLLCGGPVGDDSAVTYDIETGAWDLFPGMRLRSYDQLVLDECFVPDDDELVDSRPEDEGSAILYVMGGTVEMDYRDRRFDKPDDYYDIAWRPEMLGVAPRIQPANAS